MKQQQRVVPSPAVTGITPIGTLPPSEWRMIGPRQARAILDRDPGPPDRRIRDEKILQYAIDMEQGHWQISHQGIGIDTNDHITDGNHRLRAIIMADVTIPMLVTIGLQPEVYHVVDSGLARTTVDRAGQDWITNATVSMARRMMLGLITNAHPRPSDSIAIAFMEKHKAAIMFAVGVFHQPRRKVNVAPVRAAVARAYYHAPERELTEFADALISGICNDPKRSAVLRLREVLLTAGSGAGGAGHTAETYAKATRALRAYLDRMPLTRLYGATEDLFPLPTP